MTDPKPKMKIPVRAAKPKGGMFDNLRKPEEVESIPFEELVSPDPPPTTHHLPPTRSIAPERDFVRVPNSVVRDALPAGLFKGESKKTYDALYQRTRGAVVPRRMIRATLADVMAWAGVSHNTMKAHLKHLSRIGLIRVHYVRGDNTGAEYEVLTPEEAPPTTHHPRTTHQPATNQNLAPPTSQNLALGGGGQTVDFKEQADSSKTSFKTTTNTDDELSPLRELERELKAAPGDWRPVLQLLADELRRAAARTQKVSHPARFAEAHLTGIFAPKARPARPTAQIGASQRPPEEVEPPDPETAAEYERIRAELEKEK